MILSISGRSGVGKDTCISGIVGASDFCRFTSLTTRPKRFGEIDGVHYRFVTKEEYDRHVYRMIGKLRIDGHFYGLLADELLGQSGNIVLNLAVESAFTVKSIMPELVTIMIEPPSDKALIERLIGRGMSKKAITNRMENEPNNCFLRHCCDYSIVNYNVKDTVERILNIIGGRNELQKYRSSGETRFVRRWSSVNQSLHRGSVNRIVRQLPVMQGFMGSCADL